MAEALIDSNLSRWPYAMGEPCCCGVIRSHPEDFIVTEKLGFELTGEGEHVFLYIEKTNTNTQWVAEQLAKFANVRRFDVGYAGLKDRNAVTRQWFSIYLPKDLNVDWKAFALDDVQILQQTRHKKKLRRGTLKANHFTIILRNLTGDLTQLHQRLSTVREKGVPNYFGYQRFGHQGNNITQAEMLFEKKIKVSRDKRSLYLSSIRSWLFNCVLASRIAAGTWQKLIPGDIMMLTGCRSFFAADENDLNLQQRIDESEISPTGPLYGSGDPIPTKQVQALERGILEHYPKWLNGLQSAGLTQERRPLRLPMTSLTWEFTGDEVLTLDVDLPSGSFATAFLREIIRLVGQDGRAI